VPVDNLHVSTPFAPRNGRAAKDPFLRT
jgi:hypothetical protein